jgi:hypothetical protein
MKAIFFIIVFFLMSLTTSGCALSKGEKVACDEPLLSREQLIEIYVDKLHMRGRIGFGDVERLKRESSFTIKEEGCIYTVTKDKPLESGEQASVKINRKGELVFVFFSESGFSEGKGQACSYAPLPGEELIDIVKEKVEKESGRPGLIKDQGFEFTIREDGCDYIVSGARPMYPGGFSVKVNRKREVIYHALMG